MVRVILAAEVVDVCGRHQRSSELAREADDPLVGLLLLRQLVGLDLEVHVLAAEDADQVVEVSAGVCGTLLDQAAAEP